jgi:hypothetical protein
MYELKTYSAHPSTNTSSHLQTHLAQSLLVMPCVLQPGCKGGKDSGGGGGGGGDNGGSGNGGSGDSSCGGDNNGSGNCGSDNSSCGNDDGGASVETATVAVTTAAVAMEVAVTAAVAVMMAAVATAVALAKTATTATTSVAMTCCGDSGSGGRVDCSSGDNKGSNNGRYYGSNCGGGGISDSNSGWRQRHWWQQ